MTWTIAGTIVIPVALQHQQKCPVDNSIFNESGKNKIYLKGGDDKNELLHDSVQKSALTSEVNTLRENSLPHFLKVAQAVQHLTNR